MDQVIYHLTVSCPKCGKEQCVINLPHPIVCECGNPLCDCAGFNLNSYIESQLNKWLNNDNQRLMCSECRTNPALYQKGEFFLCAKCYQIVKGLYAKDEIEAALKSS